MNETSLFALPVKKWIAELYDPLLLDCWVESLSLSGGSRISAVTVRLRGDRTEELVLRQIVNSDWLRREGDLVIREATALRLMSSTSVSTPKVVATDPLGERTGFPALLMSRLVGDNWGPSRNLTAGALAALAKTLRDVHDVSTHAVREVLPLYSPHHWESDRIESCPPWVGSISVWQKAVTITRDWQQDTSGIAEINLVHRDYRLENMLWKGDSIVAVLDWVTACRGHAMADIGHCRWNLARNYGMEAATAFTSQYGINSYNHVWDIYAATGGAPDTIPQTRGEVIRLNGFLESAIHSTT